MVSTEVKLWFSSSLENFWPDPYGTLSEVALFFEKMHKVFKNKAQGCSTPLIKQLLTKYQIFTILPQIPHLHKIVIFQAYLQLLRPTASSLYIFDRDMSGILFHFCQLWAVNVLAVSGVGFPIECSLYLILSYNKWLRDPTIYGIGVGEGSWWGWGFSFGNWVLVPISLKYVWEFNLSGWIFDLFVIFPWPRSLDWLFGRLFQESIAI